MRPLSKILLLLIVIVSLHAEVTVNPISGISESNLIFSGTIQLDNSSLFFTYFGYDNQTDINNLKNYPLLIVVGNPGTSSLYYSLGGIGPVNLQNDMTLSENPYRFTTFTNLMFIDLPGCGFSFVKDPEGLPSQYSAYATVLSDAVNLFVKESVLGKSSKMVLAGQSTFIRSLPGLGDITALEGLIHLSAWPELYAIGRYYGIAGVELGIFGSVEKISIDSTFTTCYTNLRSGKYYQAHICMDAIFNYVQLKTKNQNLFNVKLESNLTDFLPMIQYYYSQSSVVSQWKAPTNLLFESQSGYVFNKSYVDMAKNYTKDLSSFMRDFYSVRHWFIQGQLDYICYYKGLRNWVDNELSFVESDTFRNTKLEDIVIQGKIVGYAKAVKQVAYSQVIQSGHHMFHDNPAVLGPMFRSWLATLKDEPKNIQTEQHQELI